MVKLEELFGVCPYVTTQKILSGKWSMIILYLLSQGTHRYNELNKKIPDVSQATLTSQLRALEKAGVIERIVYPEVPPKVEYKLSPLGEEFTVVLEAINDFGTKYINYLKKHPEMSIKNPKK